jgi:hypothetical protein
MYVDSPHIRDWVDAGQGVLVDSTLGDEFHHYLMALDWLPTRVNWVNIEHAVVDCASTPSAEIVRAGREFPIGQHSHIFVFFAPGEPGILSEFSSVLESIETLYWKASGSPRYFCGADIVNGRPALSPHDFAEYDGLHSITFRSSS